MLPWVDKLREIEERYEELSRMRPPPSSGRRPTQRCGRWPTGNSRPSRGDGRPWSASCRSCCFPRTRPTRRAGSWRSEPGPGGMKEAIRAIEGKGAFRKLRHESGVHRVQRVPATEASGRIHTSTVTIAVLPEAEEVDVQIDPKELQSDVFRARGA